MKFLTSFILVFATMLGTSPISFAQVTPGTQTPGFFSTTNYVNNPSCLRNDANITDASGIVSRTTTTPLVAGASCLIDGTASGQFARFTMRTFDLGLDGQNCEARFAFNGDASLYKAYVEAPASTRISQELTLSNQTSAPRVASVVFPCGVSTDAKTLVLETTSASAAAIRVADVYTGRATGVGSVAQSVHKGSIRITGCVDWTRSNTAFGSFGTTTGCSYSVTGDVLAPLTMLPGFRLQSVGPGRYLIFARGSWYKSVTTTNSDAYLRFSDGTNTFGEQATGGPVSSSGQAFTASSGMSAATTYTSAQSTLTFQLEGKLTNTASGTGLIVSDDSGAGSNAAYTEGLQFDVYYFPTSSQTIIEANQQRTPTITRYTSGSGTYTTPRGVTYLRVRGCGSGGGGSSSGTAATNNGGVGASTTFGSSLLTGAGGVGGTIGTGTAAGGTATVNAPAIGIPIAGANGQGAQFNTLSDGTHGGQGGSTIFGGGGAGGAYGGAGSAAIANSGSGGGGGGGNSAVAGVYAGGGGGAGGCFDALISAPGTTFAYGIGASGAGGGAGTSGFAGGASGLGQLEITEFYGHTTALIANSVSTGTTNGERIERAKVVCSGSSSVTSQSGSWVTSIANISTGWCAMVWPATTFSAAPTCVATMLSCAAPSGASCFAGWSASPPSTTGGSITCVSDTGANCTTANVDIQCMGPR